MEPERDHENKANMAQEPSSAKSFRFCDLPAELRNEIYDQIHKDVQPVFPGEDPVDWGPRLLMRRHGPNSASKGEIRSFLGKNSYFGLTMVNRAIRSEFRSEYLKSALVQISSSNYSVFMSTFVLPADGVRPHTLFLEIPSWAHLRRLPAIDMLPIFRIQSALHHLPIVAIMAQQFGGWMIPSFWLSGLWSIHERISKDVENLPLRAVLVTIDCHATVQLELQIDDERGVSWGDRFALEELCGPARRLARNTGRSPSCLSLPLWRPAST